jgi:DinB superfamily
VEDRPQYEPMGRDERVERDRYNEQSPETVAAEITAAADGLADYLDGLDDVGWERQGIYNYPTREARTVTWMADHTLHELVHHLRDMDDLLAVAR